MWTPLAKAAQSGADDPPPIRLTEGVPVARAATRRAIGGGGLCQGTDGAAERVEQAAAGFDDHGGGKIFEASSEGERGQMLREGAGHRSCFLKWWFKSTE